MFGWEGSWEAAFLYFFWLVVSTMITSDGCKIDWIDMGISPANSGMTFEETKDLTCSFNFQLIAFTIPQYGMIIPKRLWHFPRVWPFCSNEVNSAEAMDKDELSKFRGVLKVDMTQSSIVQIMKLLSDLEDLDVFGIHMEVDQLMGEERLLQALHAAKKVESDLAEAGKSKEKPTKPAATAPGTGPCSWSRGPLRNCYRRGRVRRIMSRHPLLALKASRSTMSPCFTWAVARMRRWRPGTHDFPGHSKWLHWRRSSSSGKVRHWVWRCPGLFGRTVALQLLLWFCQTSCGSFVPTTSSHHYRPRPAGECCGQQRAAGAPGRHGRSADGTSGMVAAAQPPAVRAPVGALVPTDGCRHARWAGRVRGGCRASRWSWPGVAGTGGTGLAEGGAEADSRVDVW